MNSNQSSIKIRKAAKILDDNIEKHEIKSVINSFDDECEIEIFGITFKGKEKLEKVLRRLYSIIGEFKFEPIVILVDNNTFFEEFNIVIKKENKEFKIKAAEVLIYKNYKVKKIRLYLDRIQISNIIAKGLFERFIVGFINKKSLKYFKIK